MKIRLAILEDCKGCAELSRIEELRPADSDFISEGYFRTFIDRDKMFFVAEEEGEIIGYILGEPMKGGLAYLGLFTVSKGFRGKGIGKQLLSVFRKRCDEKKLKVLILYAPKFNKDTLKFYKKCGFKKGKEHIQFLEVRG